MYHRYLAINYGPILEDINGYLWSHYTMDLAAENKE